mgnify:CR=1 FL=1
MIVKEIPKRLVRMQLEIHNDGLYVAVYDHEDDQGLRTLFKVAIEDLIKDSLSNSSLMIKDVSSDLIFELDCMINYISCFKNKKICERDTESNFPDSGFTDSF